MIYQLTWTDTPFPLANVKRRTDSSVLDTGCFVVPKTSSTIVTFPIAYSWISKRLNDAVCTHSIDSKSAATIQLCPPMLFFSLCCWTADFTATQNTQIHFSLVGVWQQNANRYDCVQQNIYTAAVMFIFNATSGISVWLFYFLFRGIGDRVVGKIKPQACRKHTHKQWLWLCLCRIKQRERVELK